MANRLSPQKERISAALEKKLVAEARVIAERDGIALTDVIRDAIAQYIAEVKSKTKKDSNAK